MARTILFLNSSVGRFGSDRQLLAMVGSLDPRRYRAVVVLPGDEAEPAVRTPLGAELAAAGAQVVDHHLTVVQRQHLSAAGGAALLRDLARDAKTLRRLGREVGADLIHTNTGIVIGGPVAAKLLGIPHVWHLRENLTHWARLWPLHRRLLGTATTLVCVSDATRAPVRDHRDARVIYDGVHAPRADPGGLRAQLSLPDGAVVCTVFGRISRQKGQPVFIEAVARRPLAGRHVVGLIAGAAAPGDEAVGAEFEARAADLGLADRVRFLGHVEDVGGLLAATDIVVVPSVWPDPLPNSAIEAALAGRCVVGADHGGIPEILDHGAAGRLVEPGDASALAEALTDLVDRPHERDRLGAVAAEQARRRFDVRRLGNEVQALYDELLEVGQDKRGADARWTNVEVTPTASRAGRSSLVSRSR